jgi:hypothetical protein
LSIDIAGTNNLALGIAGILSGQKEKAAPCNQKPVIKAHRFRQRGWVDDFFRHSTNPYFLGTTLKL